jgi:hypothetical protein
LVIANKGKEGEGFDICESCGAAWLAEEGPPGGNHGRPFLLPTYVRTREQAPLKWRGNIRRALFLGHQFRTDILLLRVLFHAPLDFSPHQPWLYDALATLADTFHCI